jgi:hypothetical protein
MRADSFRGIGVFIAQKIACPRGPAKSDIVQAGSINKTKVVSPYLLSAKVRQNFILVFPAYSH